MERHFHLASFYADIGAGAKEKHALRQDLVRGLKDYYEHLYGYDRYGAETVLLLRERMGVPYIYGFALLRILHDRRLSVTTRSAAARRALDVASYGEDGGLPLALLGALHFLVTEGDVSVDDLRYGLLITAGENRPFHAMDKVDATNFFVRLMANDEMPVVERLFWGHSLLSRHMDDPGGVAMIAALLGQRDLPVAGRLELCRAWTYSRQPRLDVDIPEGEGERARFVRDRLPFWVAHVPSWSSLQMLRQGVVWQARLGEDPLEVAERYLLDSGRHIEQIDAGVADLLAEFWKTMPETRVRELIDRGIGIPGSIPTRRRFYRLGAELFGADYLERASTDTAGSVRQWAVKQLQNSP